MVDAARSLGQRPARAAPSAAGSARPPPTPRSPPACGHPGPGRPATAAGPAPRRPGPARAAGRSGRRGSAGPSIAPMYAAGVAQRHLQQRHVELAGAAGTRSVWTSRPSTGWMRRTGCEPHHRPQRRPWPRPVTSRLPAHSLGDGVQGCPAPPQAKRGKGATRAAQRRAGTPGRQAGTPAAGGQAGRAGPAAAGPAGAADRQRGGRVNGSGRATRRSWRSGFPGCRGRLLALERGDQGVPPRASGTTVSTAFIWPRASAVTVGEGHGPGSIPVTAASRPAPHVELEQHGAAGPDRAAQQQRDVLHRGPLALVLAGPRVGHQLGVAGDHGVQHAQAVAAQRGAGAARVVVVFMVVSPAGTGLAARVPGGGMASPRCRCGC